MLTWTKHGPAFAAADGGKYLRTETKSGAILSRVVGDRLVRGKYVFEMSTIAPTDAELTTEYLISATRDIAGDAVYRYEMDQSGRIIQVFPAGAPE